MTRHWFPHVLALLQAMLHLCLVSSTYWTATLRDENFDAMRFLRADLERPLFEPYGFCGAWSHLSAGQAAALGLDFPAYLAASLLHRAIVQQASCVEAVMTPRGHILVTALALPVWFWVGLSLQRLARRRWPSRVQERAIVPIGSIPLPLAVLGLISSYSAFLLLEWGLALQLAGMAGWGLFMATLAAEKLRVWPFTQSDT